MIIQILFTSLVIIWTIATLLLISLIIRYRKSLIQIIKVLQVTNKNLLGDAQQFKQMKRTIDEFKKFNQQIKK